MPTNTSIATKSTGNVLAAGDWNALTVLNTTLALFKTSTTGSAGATPPAVTAPNFLVQAGYNVLTFASASGTLTFPSAFPNGILCVIGNVNPASGASQLCVTSSSTTQAVFQAYSPTGGAASGSHYVNWIAIGW